MQQGALTNEGLAHIGKYERNLNWVFLSTTRESDVGLTNLAYGCQQLECMEVQDCPYGEASFVIVAVAISSLKYLWVQGHHQVNETWAQLMDLSCPRLHIKVYLRTTWVAIGICTNITTH